MKSTANALVLVLVSSATACLGQPQMSGDAGNDSGPSVADAASEAGASTKDNRLVGEWRQTMVLPQYTAATHYYFAADGALQIGLQRPEMQGATCAGEIRRAGFSWETSDSNLVIRGLRTGTCAGEIRCSNPAGQTITVGCEDDRNWGAQVDPLTVQYTVSADGNSLSLGESLLSRVR